MFFVTIPHCGERIPPAFLSRMNPQANLRAMAEPGLDRVCQWEGVTQVCGEMHMCITNLNRSKDNQNPRLGTPYLLALSQNILLDFTGTPLYLAGKEPSADERAQFLDQYYDPFFQEIDRLVESGRYHFFADVHTMNRSSTSYADKAHMLHERPEICLSNNGTITGEEHADGSPLTFPPKLLQKLAAALVDAGYSCALNDPFRGGYIMQTYGARIPCMQIEMRKDLCMTSDDGALLAERIDVLNRDLFAALQRVDAEF